MPKEIVQYDLLISCPGDITDEIKLIEEAVAQFNTQFSDVLGITVRTRHWRKNSYAQSGGKPQALLNEQFVCDCDAAVAVLWTRFGTPTDEYGSGTEEEIEIMLNSGKQVFMYFSDKPLPPSQQNPVEYARVQEFRKKYKDRGIYFNFSSNEEFKELFFAHLSQHFLSEKRVAEITAERHSVLKLMGINQANQLSDLVSVQQFVPNVKYTMTDFIGRIRSLFNEIAGLQVGKRSKGTNSPYTLSLSTPLEISDDDRKYLISIARQLELDLPDDFFDLGNLTKSSIPTGIFGSSQIDGTDDEKTKYHKIVKLKEIISECLEWAPIEDAFSGKTCLRLALQNCGTAVDEGIEITITISKECLLAINEFPKFDNDIMGYLLNDCDMDTLFGIESTSEYLSYDSVQKVFAHPIRNTNIGLPGYVPDYSEDFIDELNGVFCYSVYEIDDSYLLKLKVDYIKHHTAVAFPSIIFVKASPKSIPYTITSRNSATIISGELLFE